MSIERKLAAILSADVQGYSRLMGADEEATIHTLTAYHAVMTRHIEQHRGRVVDAPGDNLLAEFTSVVDAVRCAGEIQRDLKVRNAALPDSRRIECRIGINLGDVVVEGERLYSDGVNIAARYWPPCLCWWWGWRAASSYTSSVLPRRLSASLRTRLRRCRCPTSLPSSCYPSST